MEHFGRALPLLVGAVFWACGGAPERASSPPSPVLSMRGSPPSAVSAQAPALDECAAEPGQPPPEPLRRPYTGVAAKARCQREVYTVMAGVTQALGVACKYCHLVPDYEATTQRKEIANWMASELIPALRRPDGSVPRCKDCHVADGRGVAKILGNPRRASFAVEWMTTHLVTDFQGAHGEALHCKACHQANLGSPGFERSVILTQHLPAK